MNHGSFRFKPVVVAIFISLALIYSFFSLSDNTQKADEWTIHSPAFFIQHQSYELEICFPDTNIPSRPSFQFENETLAYQTDSSRFILSVNFAESGTLRLVDLESQATIAQESIRVIPLWLSILPPLIAILLALLLKEVFSALLIGLFSGTLILAWGKSHQGASIFFHALSDIPDEFILPSLSNPDHLSILVFSLLIGAMVKLISSNGGMEGIVQRITPLARSSVSGQFATWLMGLSIFFDDYANTLLVGNTMRPLSDKLRISREKLAYLVDSTAAPIASIAFITTWIGAELSYIQQGIDEIGLELSPYSIFLDSLAYSFYPILTLLFILIIVFSKREYGPMFTIEQKARIHNQSPRIEAIEHSTNPRQLAKSYNALIPVLVVVGVTLIGLYLTGSSQHQWDPTIGIGRNISAILAGANTYQALLWSSGSGVLVALILSISQRIFTLSESMEILIEGLKSMMHAVVILVLAWSLARLTRELETASFITSVLINWEVSAFWVPALSFIVAALVAFATGSSWGTMAILYPLMIPAIWNLGHQAGIDPELSYGLFLNVVSVILAGSVLGDHCSPISDTTIMSSLASSCNHLEHVRTQLPYALTVGGVSVLAGTIPASFGISTWFLFPVALLLLIGIVFLLGKPVSTYQHYK